MPEVPGDYIGHVQVYGYDNILDNSVLPFYISIRNKLTADGRVLLDGQGEPQLEAELIPGYIDDYGEKQELVFSDTPNTYFTVLKSVSGNTSNADEYFKFTLSFGEDFYGNTYDVDYTILGLDSEVEYHGQIIHQDQTTFSTSEEAVFYLKHNQEITVGLAIPNSTYYELPSGLSYNIEEEDDGYISYIGNTDLSYTSCSYSIYGHYLSNNETCNDIIALNFKNQQIPTGILIKLSPFIILLSFGLLLLFLKRGRVKV